MKPATMRYFDAIHAQLDALDTWRADRPEFSVEVVSGAIDLLRKAEPYFLDGDIQEWIMDSAASFPNDICIRDVLPPSHRGWILFERPIPHPLATTDREQIISWWTESPEADISLGWAALAWSTIDQVRHHHLVHCPYHDPDKTKNPSLSILEKEDGGLYVRCLNGCSSDDVVRCIREGGFQFPEGTGKHSEEPPAVTLDYYHRTHDNRLVLRSTQTWPFHEGLASWGARLALQSGNIAHGLDALHKEYPKVHEIAQHAEEGRASFVISLFAFMNQPFSTAESRRLPRAQRRSLQREAGLEDPQVKVITLRRTQHTKGQSNGGSTAWACRWFVKGHWRSQYYARTQQNRPLWIMPYMKGPEDKPLKGNKSIALYHVTR